jgi:hypothetical protein
MVSVGTPRPTHGTRSNETRHGSNATTIGGYVVGPGSVNKARYYAITDERPVVPLPAWIRAALLPKPSAVPLPAPRQHADHYLAAILQGETARVRTAPPGARNNALNVAAYLLGQLVGSGAISEADARFVLQEAASVHVGVSGFTEQEMHRTITSGLTAGVRCPRYLTPRSGRGAYA